MVKEHDNHGSNARRSDLYRNLYSLPLQMAATQEASSSPAPSAQVVGNAFVGQYYHILHHSPQSVHRFYQDSSLLSRPDVNGVMTTVTGMQAINDKIISLNYGDYTAEIITADAQESHEKGVIVLVTGCLTGKDNLRRKFSQTFFLAPQDKGYYVLNDVLRHVEETESNRSNSSSGDAIKENTTTVTSTPEPEPSHAPNHLTVEPPISLEEEDMNNDPEVCDPSKDAPKKSYASIVKVPKSISGPVYVATTPVRAAPPANPDHQSIGLAKPAPVPDASAVNGDNLPESSNLHEEAEGHSIYVRNLPFDATVEQLEEEFKKFGPIKRDGIQVRSNKQGFCFGFVEFEQLSSVHGALEASPVTIGDRQAVVEEKRTTTRVSGSGRGGRFPTGRGGGFRSDSFRARGNYGGGRGYGRNDFRNQGEFAGRARGSTGRNGDGYQRANQNGGGRGGGRQGGVNRSAVSG
ncbi:Nuclear transport factor 2, partial [Cucurbita argyrosperma subsp. sororia]